MMTYEEFVADATTGNTKSDYLAYAKALGYDLCCADMDCNC